MKTLLCANAALGVLFATTACAEEKSGFQPGESQQDVIEHHRRIPADDHWWNVTGPEQGWIHRNLQQIFPSTPVYRDGQVRMLQSVENPDIGNALVMTDDGPIPFNEFVGSEHSTMMGIVIVEKGKIAFESYPRMREHEKVGYWSTSKVLAGAIVRLLEERGEIDIAKPIEYYISRLADSAYKGVTVQNILDMASGINCGDDYLDPTSCYYLYSEAIGDNLRNANSPDNPYDFMATVEAKRVRPQGEKFVYSGAENFLAMWLIEEVTGHTFADNLSEEFWTKIGAENDAGFFAYRYGISVSHGGFFSRLRDMARFGMLYTPSWNKVSDEKIITDDHLEAIMTANRPGLRPTAYSWGSRDENGWIEHGGWGGQELIINPEKDVVVVYAGYFPEKIDTYDQRKHTESFPAVMQVLNSVYGVDP